MTPLGLWWGTVEGAGIRELALAAGGAGFGRISVSPPMYFAARAAGQSDAELQRVLAAGALSVAMIDPLIRGLPGSPLPEQVARRFRPTFEHGEADCYRAAEALGARALNLAHYLCAPAALGALVDAIGALCARAAGRGFEVWLEFMPDGGIPDLATASAILRAVGSPNLGLTLDTWHWFRTAAPLEELRQLPPGSLRALQLADANADLRGTGVKPPTADRLLPGSGAIPLREILSIARENHPGVEIGVELFDRARLGEPALERARAAAGALRALVDQSRGCTSDER